MEGTEAAWNTFGIVGNAASDVLNAAVIPIYNTVAYTVFEPLIMLILEVFSLVFLSHSYKGVLTEEQFPYAGISCLASAEAARWCGRYSYSADRLVESESGQGFKSESQFLAAASRRMLNERSTVALSIDTARRLSEISDADFIVPAFDISDLTDALDEVSTIFVVISAPLADTLFAVLWEVLQSSAVFILNALALLLETAIGLLKMAVKIGFLGTIVTIGIDFVIIFLTKLFLPMLFAAVDAVICMIDLFSPHSWDAQLECIQDTCFYGANAANDLWVFTSVPVVMDLYGSIVQDTLNSRTGRRYTGGKTFDFGFGDGFCRPHSRPGDSEMRGVLCLQVSGSSCLIQTFSVPNRPLSSRVPSLLRS